MFEGVNMTVAELITRLQQYDPASQVEFFFPGDHENFDLEIFVIEKEDDKTVVTFVPL